MRVFICIIIAAGLFLLKVACEKVMKRIDIKRRAESNRKRAKAAMWAGIFTTTDLSVK